MGGEADIKTDLSATEGKETTKKKQRGVFSRIWNGLFRTHGDDFEKRLQHISKEEAAIISRIRRRSQSWRGLARNLIVISVILEVVAVGYAVMTTRTLEIEWKMRALRVLPMFLLPALSTITYLALGNFTKMLDRKDQSNLERLRTERQERIDELKEKTNYYITQQLIQKYDTDPAAKAAAASILASKLGADSGLKVYLGNESDYNNVPTGKSNDVQLTQTNNLRHRKQQMLTRSNSTGSTIMQQSHEDMLQNNMTNMGSEVSCYDNQVMTEHYRPGPAPLDGGWFARVAAMLVGEDPTQCYALICGNCHMHNGLARKEDFPFVTYYCPHCNALNRSNNIESTSGLDPSGINSTVTTSNIMPTETAATSSPDSELVKSSSVGASFDTVEGSDVSVSNDPKPVS